jgi:cytoskeletal protein CcmA (bactofilin family)
MPNYTVQLRRGTSGEHGSFTGAVGEITVNTSNSSIHVHDGSTAGGTELATKAALDAKTLDNLIDADSDTHVKVEATSDSDEILFTAAGTAVMKMTSGALLPMVNSNGSTGFDLGASNAQWKDLYVSSGSLYVNGKQVLQDDSGTITVSTTTNQDLKLVTSGTGDLKIECAAGGNIEMNGDIQLNASNKVTGHWTVGNVKIDGSSITNSANNENLNLVTTGTGKINFADDVTAAGSITVTGDLTVNGTTTTVNSTVMTVTDPLILLNEGASGSNAKDLGIVFERGADTNRAMIWDESADVFAFINTGEDGTTAGDVTVTSYADIRVDTMTGTATAAQYADLAERYHGGNFDAGTVVCFGGEHEIESCDEEGCTRVAGVISTAPAFMMNKDAGNDDSHPYVALAGRVPCKVTGEIHKGDMLTTAGNGHAKASDFIGGAMIGKALEDFNGESGTIEIAVHLM